MTTTPQNIPTPAFTTDRLRVFETIVAPLATSGAHRVFLACRSDVDQPMVTVHAMLCRWPDGWFVDWIETAEIYRRQGFARELLAGIDEQLGQPVLLHPATPAGRAFCRAVGEERRQ